MKIGAKSPLFAVTFMTFIWIGAFFSTKPEIITTNYMEGYFVAVLIISVPFLFVLATILRFRLILGETIQYRSLFKVHAINLSEIREVQAKSGYSDVSGKYNFFQRSFLPPFRLEFFIRGSDRPFFFVNRAVIGRGGERDLFDFLSKHGVSFTK